MMHRLVIAGVNSSLRGSRWKGDCPDSLPSIRHCVHHLEEGGTHMTNIITPTAQLSTLTS